MTSYKCWHYLFSVQRIEKNKLFFIKRSQAGAMSFVQIEKSASTAGKIKEGAKY
jgi:hypothetical protein